MPRSYSELAAETTLSERQAQVAMRRIQGQTFYEIADELEINPATANEHWQRAKQKAADAQESVEVFEDVGLL